ncbi:MAG: efflux RND transporter periplasmic adaptor subunit [Campylobacter sp.]|nr:efflux RND transporter periplasmic adaptor subunit [Campylobacter sp.]
MKKIIKLLIFIVLLLIVVTFIYFKFIKEDTSVKYLTAKPLTGTLTNSVIATGEISARDLVDVGAQVGGQIKKLYVEVGDKVKKGDLIAQIDSVKQKNEIEKTKAQHEIYMADLNATKIAAEIAVTKFNREQKLYKERATSREAFEDAQNQAALKVAEVAQIEAQIRQNQIDLDTAMTNLGYTEIISPLDGIIVSTIVKEGQTVNANQTTPLIVQIADLSKLEINMEIAEGDLPRIKEQMKVRYTILADSNLVMEGRIDKIDPAMTTLSDGSLTKNSTSSTSDSAVYYYAKILVDNTDGFLRIGMTTENEIIIQESKDTIYIPKSAIKKEDNINFVNVLKNGKSTKKTVTLGISDGFYQEILSGLEPNDDVIMNDSSGIVKQNQNIRMPGMRM